MTLSTKNAIAMNQELQEGLQKIIRERFAVPSEFWLHIESIQTQRFRNNRRFGESALEEINPRPAHDVIWLIEPPSRPDRENPMAFAEIDETILPNPFFDVKKCFCQLGIDQKTGNLIWGYVYFQGGGTTTELSSRVYNITVSLEDFIASGAPFYNNKTVRAIGDWQNQTMRSVKEWQLLIDAAMGRDIVPEQVLRIRNLEMRRYLVKKIGYEKLKKMIPSLQVIHRDRKRGEELFDIVLPEEIERPIRTEPVDDPRFSGWTQFSTRSNGRRMRFVKVKDASTDREYILAVPNNVDTCHEAVAWTFGFEGEDAENYKPTYET